MILSFNSSPAIGSWCAFVSSSVPGSSCSNISFAKLVPESVIKVKSSHHNSPTCLFLLVPVQARQRGPRRLQEMPLHPPTMAPRQGGIHKPSHVKFHKSFQLFFPFFFFTKSWPLISLRFPSAPGPGMSLRGRWLHLLHCSSFMTEQHPGFKGRLACLHLLPAMHGDGPPPIYERWSWFWLYALFLFFPPGP